jgi:hypothetical protein
VTRLSSIWLKLLVASIGLAGGLAIAEITLRLADLPRFHQPHSTPHQFVFRSDPATQEFYYTNLESDVITFVYHSDPRDYFEHGSVIRHETNAHGFRGPELDSPVPPGALRIAFLGDSFTFGEGVHFEDTFAEATLRLLGEAFAGEPIHFVGYNFGVGGYNTGQSLGVLERTVLRMRPDLVVLCYVLNDAEPTLFFLDPQLREPVRRPRAIERTFQNRPPDTGLYSLRVTQLLWRAISVREQRTRTEAFYRGLYEPEAKAWRDTRRALQRMAALTAAEQIPLLVMIFPLLHQLDDRHPYTNLYEQVSAVVLEAGADALSLFPSFKGRDGEELWVHPTDQHPNEEAHLIAARRLASHLAADPGFQRLVQRKGGRDARAD